jgi:hypothetical protein
VAIAEVSGLQTALDGKQAAGSYAASSHTHTIANVTSLQAALDGKSDVGHTHAGGGSDPWTYVKLASDFVTSSSTAVAVTGLAFAPAAAQTYVVEGFFFVRTATATVGPRPGVTWPTGTTDGAAAVDVTSSATAKVFANGNPAGAVLAPVGGLPTTTASWPSSLWATLVTGASPSGNLQITLASETAGTNVTMKAGSWIRYRTI